MLPPDPNASETDTTDIEAVETDIVELAPAPEVLEAEREARGARGKGELSLIEAAKLQAQHRSSPALRGAGPGGSIPGYRILRELHRGGQGVVYLAIQEGTRRKVAVKVMREGPFSSANDRLRFEREVQVLAQLNNPNVVAIHDSGVFAGSYYYVMDFIAGHTLDDYVKVHESAHTDILRLFVTICQAVNAAHLRGVIHRDLKPSNIRVSPHGVPHVLDFGLAKMEGGEGEQTVPTAMTMTGQFVGSMPWASPEQALGEGRRLDVRTDVYSLGVILYQLICGRFPYRVEGPMRVVADEIAKADPVGPRSIDKRITRDIERIMLKALSKDPEHRYQTAGEMARDLERCLAGDPIEARRDSFRYLLRKFVTKYRVRAAIAAAALVGLVASAIGFSVLSAQNSRRAQDVADLQAEIDRLEQENAQLRRRLGED